MLDWRWQWRPIFGVFPEHDMRGRSRPSWGDADRLKVESSPWTVLLSRRRLCFASSFLCLFLFLFRTFLCGILVVWAGAGDLGVCTFRTRMRSTGMHVETSNGGQGWIVFELCVPRCENGNQFPLDLGICSGVGGEVLYGFDELVVHAGGYASGNEWASV